MTDDIMSLHDQAPCAVGRQVGLTVNPADELVPGRCRKRSGWGLGLQVVNLVLVQGHQAVDLAVRIVQITGIALAPPTQCIRRRRAAVRPAGGGVQKGAFVGLAGFVVYEARAS